MDKGFLWAYCNYKKQLPFDCKTVLCLMRVYSEAFALFPHVLDLMHGNSTYEGTDQLRGFSRLEFFKDLI